MGVKYKIILAFTLLATLLLSAYALFTYYSTKQQFKKDFSRRLENRALTVAALLNDRQPDNFSLLSQVDSATTNMLSEENINIFNSRNERIYRYAKKYEDTVFINNEVINNARIKKVLFTTAGEKQLAAIYYTSMQFPVVVTVSAVDENGLINLQELQHNLLNGLLIGIALSFIAGMLFSKSIVRPIKRISTTVNEISAKNIDRRLPVGTVKDEWQLLTTTFNDLLNRLQESFEIQGRFIANASHELSTPLTSINNQVQVILKKERSNQEYTAVLRSIQTDTEHLCNITQQLLNMARTVRGGALQIEEIRVDELMLDVQSLIYKLGYSGVTISFDELPDNEARCTIYGNEELLKIALKNIIENGCKYATDKKVNVSLSFIPSKVILICSNNADVSKDEDLKELFQPFQRGSNTEGIPGHGLGLALARRIVLMHRGDIKAESTASGKILIIITFPAIL